MPKETLVGWKRSALSSWCEYSASHIQSTRDSLSMVTTMELLKAGGQVVIATQKQIPSSNAYTISSLKLISYGKFELNTSQVNVIQQTDCLMGSTPLSIHSFCEFPSLLPYSPSSSMLSIQLPQTSTSPFPLSLHLPPGKAENDAFLRLKSNFAQCFKRRTSSLRRHFINNNDGVRFDSPLSSHTVLSLQENNSNSLPHPYPSSLTPCSSVLRPHCKARDRL